MNHFFLRGGHAQHSFMVVGLALISYEMLASKDRLFRALDDALRPDPASGLRIERLRLQTFHGCLGLRVGGVHQ